MKAFVYNGARTALDKVLTKEIGYALTQKALRLREVKINGRRAAKDAEVISGDKIAVYLEFKNPLVGRVLYEDGNVIVLNKPINMDTYEAADVLKEQYGEIYPVHRLDRNTTGVMIFARGTDVKEELEDCFKQGRTNKIYRAVLKGAPMPRHAVCTAYLVKDADNSTVKIYDRPVPEALTIVTEYRVTGVRGDVSEAEITLHTGRTHQIRAHMAHLGYPVLGDGKYGDNAFNRAHNKKYQCLTCIKLSLHSDGLLSYLNGVEFKLTE